jgi:hypothetical protein
MTIAGSVDSLVKVTNDLLAAMKNAKKGNRPAVEYAAGYVVNDPTFTVHFNSATYLPKQDKMPFTTGAVFDITCWMLLSIDYDSYRKINRRGRLYSQGSLPRLFAKMMAYNEGSPEILKTVGLGSSVGLGFSLADPATQAPVNYFHQKLMARFNAANIYKFASPINGSVSGSSVPTASSELDKAVSAGNTPTVLVLAYGMNDGRPENYNTQGGFNGFMSGLYDVASRAIELGSDVVIMTTPHPNTDAYTYTGLPGGFFMTYPVYKPAPVAASDLIPPPAQSTVSCDPLGRGKNINLATRWLRINEAMRWVAMSLNLTLIDVEKYWIEALYDNPVETIMPASETFHPNLLGHQLSYWMAIDDFVESMTESHGFGGTNFGFGDRVGVNTNGRPAAILQANAPNGDTSTQRMNLFGAVTLDAANNMALSANSLTLPSKQNVDYGNGESGAVTTWRGSASDPINLDMTGADGAALLLVFGSHGAVGQSVGLYLIKKTGVSTTLFAIREDNNYSRPFNVGISGNQITISPVTGGVSIGYNLIRV